MKRWARGQCSDFRRAATDLFARCADSEHSAVVFVAAGNANRRSKATLRAGFLARRFPERIRRATLPPEPCVRAVTAGYGER
jgi:hypothetical protein